jgi:hypothetical protein
MVSGVHLVTKSFVNAIRHICSQIGRFIGLVRLKGIYDALKGIYENGLNIEIKTVVIPSRYR